MRNPKLRGDLEPDQSQTKEGSPSPASCITHSGQSALPRKPHQLGMNEGSHLLPPQYHCSHTISGHGGAIHSSHYGRWLLMDLACMKLSNPPFEATYISGHQHILCSEFHRLILC